MVNAMEAGRNFSSSKELGDALLKVQQLIRDLVGQGVSAELIAFHVQEAFQQKAVPLNVEGSEKDITLSSAEEHGPAGFENDPKQDTVGIHFA